MKRYALLSTILVFPILYVLSIGPFLWLTSGGYLQPATFERWGSYYTPVIELSNHAPPFRKVLEWYMYWDLWNAMHPPSDPPTPPAPIE